VVITLGTVSRLRVWLARLVRVAMRTVVAWRTGIRGLTRRARRLTCERDRSEDAGRQYDGQREISDNGFHNFLLSGL
jgi:hypothetical protein